MVRTAKKEDNVVRRLTGRKSGRNSNVGTLNIWYQKGSKYYRFDKKIGGVRFVKDSKDLGYLKRLRLLYLKAVSIELLESGLTSTEVGRLTRIDKKTVEWWYHEHYRPTPVLFGYSFILTLESKV